MNYSARDTEWATSAKGNTWKLINGIALIVGKRKDGRWWARRGDDFMKGSFSTKHEAMNAAEHGHDGEDTPECEDNEWWG
jgi:hypothetical protein